MSGKGSGCGWFAIIGSVVFLIIAFLVARGRLSVPSVPKIKAPPRAATSPLAPRQVEEPKALAKGMWAALSEFTLNKTSKKFKFVLNLSNEEAVQKTVYVIVYGDNPRCLPPRRSVWPNAEAVYHQAGVQRGVLRPTDISKNWASRSEESKGEKYSLGPQQAVTQKKWLPVDDICPHPPWEGKPLDSTASYKVLHIWIFSDTGELVFQNKYALE